MARQVKDVTIFKKMGALKYKADQVTTRDKALLQVMKVFDPDNTGVYHMYRDDWAEFMRVELGAKIPDLLDGLIETIQNNRLTIVPSATQMGKSWLGAMLALSFFKIYQESQVYVMAAPPQGNLMNNLLSKIRATAFNFRGVFKDDVIAAMGIKRSPDQFIQGIVIPSSGSDEARETKFSGKHQVHMLVIIDEGDAVPDFVFKAVDGWGSGGVTFHVVIFFNPKEKTGKAWDMIDNREGEVYTLSAFDHPNVIEGWQVIPGAVSRRQTLKRVFEWTHEFDEHLEDRNDSVFKVPDYLVGETLDGEYPPLPAGERKPNEDTPEFSYKVRGEYPAETEGMTVPEGWVQIAINNYKEYVKKYGKNPPEGVRPKMGLDIADTGVDHNCACFRWGGYCTFERWKGINAYKAVKRAALLYKEHNASIVFTDKSGVGAMSPGLLRAEGVGTITGVMGQERSGRSTQLGRFRLKRDELMWGVRDWLDPESGEDAMLDPHNKRLLKSIRNLKHSLIGNDIKFEEKKKFAKRIGFSPDELDSLGMTLSRAKTSFRMI